MGHKIKIVNIYFISLFLDNIQIILGTDIERELFGDGEFSISEKVISFFFSNQRNYLHPHSFISFYIFKKQRENAFGKHQSSSTEDLMSLFNAEIEAIKYLNETKSKLKNKNSVKTIEGYQNSLDYNL